MPGRARYRGAVAVKSDGIRHASRKEARRWGELQWLQKAGEITDLERQVRFPLFGRDGPILTPTGQQMHYVADFAYIEVKTGGQVIEDAKGFKMEIYLLKKAIMQAQGLHIKEV
jgi:hypothetical protein